MWYATETYMRYHVNYNPAKCGMQQKNGNIIYGEFNCNDISIW